MKIKEKSPNAKDVSRDTVSDKMKDFVRELRRKVRDDDSSRVNWMNKMVVSNNQRLGLKRYSTYPYVGAPDIPLPETDKLIKKSVPYLVLSAWQPKKMCSVEVKTFLDETIFGERPQRAEAIMNTLLRSTEFGWFKKLVQAAEYTKQYGHAIFKIYEDFHSSTSEITLDLEEQFGSMGAKAIRSQPKAELVDLFISKYGLDYEDEDEKKIIDDAVKQIKSGEELIEFTVEKITSMPNVEVLLPTKVFVPPYTTNIGKATRITVEYYLSSEKLQERMDKGIFIKKDLEDLQLVNINKDDVLEKEKGVQEGINDEFELEDRPYRLQEIYCWYKPEDSKEPAKRWVFTVLADVMHEDDAILQQMPFPFEMDEWNFEKHDNEIRDPRYYSSRGIPEQIRAIQEIMERCINNIIIRDEMNNTPVWEVLDTSDILDTAITMAPGQKIPVKTIGNEIRPLNPAIKVDASSDRIMSVLKAYAEEYLGSVDQLFKNATNTGGGKTLGEVKLGIQQTAIPTNIEVISWNDTISRVYAKIFQLFKEREDDDMVLDGVKVTKADFDFPAEIRSNGDLEIADDQMSTQKAFTRVNVLLNPALQDIVDSQDRYNTVRDWLEKDGVKDPDQFCTNPLEIAKTQLAQLKQQIMQAQQQLGMMQEKTQEEQKQQEKARALGEKGRAVAEASLETAGSLAEEVMKNQLGVEEGGGEGELQPAEELGT